MLSFEFAASSFEPAMTEPDLRSTLNLPKTVFPMKANLPQTEPRRLEQWTASDLYGRIRQARKGRPSFVLHDGPPYANGHIHLGTVLNKILKDVIVRSRSMSGLDAPYRPGWDCHGLPIELKVDRDLGAKKRQMSPIEFRRACRAYAEKYVAIQRKEFERLGVLGEWDDPYLTMSPSYQVSWPASWSWGSSTRPRNPSTGASRAGRRWRRPRSSTTSSTSVPRSTSASRSPRPTVTGSPRSTRPWPASGSPP
jgi:hypothetical protein